MAGKDNTIKIKVFVVDAKVPLLIGKDTHQSLNICTTPASSTCQLGLGSERSSYILKTTPGGHWCLKFQDISRDNDNNDNTVNSNDAEEGVNVIGILKKASKQSNNVDKYRKIQSLHRSTNHKSARNLINMYRSGEKKSMQHSRK